jgi:dihydroorotase-like cyclic amidohydrolase
MSKILIKNAQIVNEFETLKGSIVIENEYVKQIYD